MKTRTDFENIIVRGGPGLKDLNNFGLLALLLSKAKPTEQYQGASSIAVGYCIIGDGSSNFRSTQK